MKAKNTFEGLAAKTIVWPEGGFWRWRITTKRGTWVDGGNYLTKADANAGLREALDQKRRTP